MTDVCNSYRHAEMSRTQEGCPDCKQHKDENERWERVVKELERQHAKRLAAALARSKKLAEYAQHTDQCDKITVLTQHAPCTCGLSDLLGEKP